MAGFLFFVLKSESSFWAFSSSPVQPFYSGLLKPNAGKGGSEPCLGVGRFFRGDGP
jgi:hypothetical protein